MNEETNFTEWSQDNIEIDDNFEDAELIIG